MPTMGLPDIALLVWLTLLGYPTEFYANVWGRLNVLTWKSQVRNSPRSNGFPDDNFWR